MNIRLLITAALLFASVVSQAQISVPKVVQLDMTQRYPAAKNVTWKREQRNYAAMWTDKTSGQNTAVFTSGGALVAVFSPAPVKFLPPAIAAYVKAQYKTTISSAQKKTTVIGKEFYVINTRSGKTLLFDPDGKPIRH